MDILTFPGRGFDSNVFLLKGEMPVLVDTGTGAYCEETLRKVKDTGLDGRIERIVLTHRHCDHAGGAAFLAEALGANLLSPPVEAEALRRSDSSTGAMAFGVPMGPLEVDDLGSELDLGGVKLKVINTPGHTSGSVCLWDETDGRLVCGDTIFAGGGVGRWDLDTGNLGQLQGSVKMLGQLGVKAFYPGHGPNVEENAQRQIERSLASLLSW